MFVFGRQYGGSICEVHQNDFHKNVAYTIVLGRTEDITVIDKAGKSYIGPVILIKPMIEHFVAMTSSVACHIFLAPQAAFAKKLDQFGGDDGISKLMPNVLPFNSQMDDELLFKTMDKLTQTSNPNIDHRLATVLEDLDRAPSKANLVDMAARCDLSSSRLRTIAKQQLGVSLSALIVWRKLVKSMEVLASGSTLSEAAQAGGFSDQAHFSRTTRKMFGITPSNSTYALR